MQRILQHTPQLTLQHTLQHTAAPGTGGSSCCLQQKGTELPKHTANLQTHCNPLQPTAKHIATRVNTLRHCITRQQTLQHTATHCTTLQHTAAPDTDCR